MTTCLCWLTVLPVPRYALIRVKRLLQLFLFAAPKHWTWIRLTYCGVTPVPVPCNDAFPYRNTNPNFFRMACYQSGTLGSPSHPMMHRLIITGSCLMLPLPTRLIYSPTRPRFVACNWSSNLWRNWRFFHWQQPCRLFRCTAFIQPDAGYTSGHTYMLMVSNQTGAVSGYQAQL